MEANVKTATRDEALHLNRIVGICESEASDKTKVRRIYRLAVQAVALLAGEEAA